MATAIDALLTRTLNPNREDIDRITLGGDVAIVVHEPDAEACPILRTLGWDGRAPVFKLSARERKRIADNSEAIGDLVTARWLRGRRSGRVFVWMHRGTLLLNVGVDGDVRPEPGSLDGQRPQA